MSEQKTYVIEQVEEELKFRISEYYYVNNGEVTMHTDHDHRCWLLSIKFPNGTRIGTRTYFTEIAGIEVCYASEVDKAFKHLIDGVSSAVYNNLSEMIDPEVKTLPSSKHILVKNSTAYWKLNLVTCPLIATFFDIKIEKHQTKAHRLVTYTDRYSGKRLIGYFEETKSGHKRCSKNQYEFAEIQGKSSNKLKWRESPSNQKWWLDSVTGTLRLPNKGHHLSVFNTWEVIQSSDSKIVVDILRMSVTKESASKDTVRLTLLREESGKPVLEEESVELDWAEYFNCVTDTYKNPINRNVHKFLPNSDVPTYEGINIYITSNDDTFMKLAGEHWVPIKGGVHWIIGHKHAVPQEVFLETERYVLSVHLQHN